MTQMHAAVVTSFDQPPQYQLFDAPRPAGEHETLVDVLAVGLHPRVRSGAAGAHYTSTGKLPMIPGIDGVGRRPDGTRSTSSPMITCSGRWPTRRSSTFAGRSNCPAAWTWRRSPPR